ncbi:MAG: hypothetical protein NT027_06790, partial [Proteobacteria bacterium]|nr:hypothetical protein [Pseudomonadota bacterium]
MTKSFDIILTQPARASYSNIFRCFEDVELMKQWVDGLVDFHIIQSSDINQTKRRFHQISKFCGRKVEYKGKVELWNPPSQITLFVEDLNFTFEMYFQILSDNDRTRIEFKGNLQCH